MNWVKAESAAKAGNTPASSTMIESPNKVRLTVLVNLIDLYILVTYMSIDLEQITGFEWDDGNAHKSFDKHDVSQAEAESIFFNDPLAVVEDAKHSDRERRPN